uniref:Uncharacterized protein n=1 Tax=Rhizophora mucronata TaxID=61149 RepID=A0A2P2N020_RHIMU
MVYLAQSHCCTITSTMNFLEIAPHRKENCRSTLIISLSVSKSIDTPSITFQGNRSTMILARLYFTSLYMNL